MVYLDIHTHFDQKDPEIIYIKNLMAGIDLCQPEKKNFFSCGIHPWYLDEPEEKKAILMEHIKNKSVLAIGECGMDYRKKYLSKYTKELQKNIFRYQAGLGKKYNKPIIIHCVKCVNELLQIRKEFASENWIYHGFNKKSDVAKALLKKGIYLSFGASILKNETTAEALSITPLNRLFLETDDQQEYTIKEIYQRAAELVEISKEELSRQIILNAEKVFSIKITHYPDYL